MTAFIMASLLALFSCARQGSPMGGPKDEKPPEVVLEIPANRTVYFDFPQALITFNEFIALKDPAKEIFVSPPMKTKPDYKVAGKKLIIEFQEELQQNSTYTINFGNSIIDFTEGNALVNYEYVFSTGDHIDSLSIPGKILNAFDHKPETGILVMVYRDDNDTIPLDSLPLKVPPKSASKSTKDGSFSINNLAAGEYKLFALEDMNNNFIFDMPSERIAFLDSLVMLEPEMFPVLMTADSTGTADTTGIILPELAVNKNYYTLYLFTETDTVQKLISKKPAGKNLLQYIFKLPVDSAILTPLGFQTGRSDWYITEFGVVRDTVNFWLKPGHPDTVRVVMQAGPTISDTSRFVMSRFTADLKSRRRDAAPDAMNIASNTFAGAFNLNQDLTLSFAVPVEDSDLSGIHLFTPADTLVPEFIFFDPLQRKGMINYPWQPGELYHLLIADSVFCDLSGAYNDSTSIRFKVRTMEDYGTLLMNVTVPEMSGQLIIQLMTDKEIKVQQKILSASGAVQFRYLMPGNYKLKMIFDENSNGKWDSGNYYKYSLPERIEYYETPLNIRSNWDLQEDWQVN